MPPTAAQIAKARCRCSFLPMWQIFQPGEYFRAFERGGLTNNPIPPEIGNPNPAG